MTHPNPIEELYNMYSKKKQEQMTEVEVGLGMDLDSEYRLANPYLKL